MTEKTYILDQLHGYGYKLYKAKRWWGPEKYTDFLKCLADKRLRKSYTPNWGEFV